MEMDVAIAVATDGALDEGPSSPWGPDGIDALLLLGALLGGVIYFWAAARIRRR